MLQVVRLTLGAVLLMLPLLSGCQASVASRLVGKWRGQPDSTAAAAERTAKLKARQQAEQGASADVEPDEPATAPGKTDLEAHDVTVVLDFRSDQTVEMSLADGTQPLAGVWRVVESLPPNGAMIEISLSASDDAAGSDATEPAEKRRFVINFQQNGEAPGFTLVEKGADPRFGRLYFTRFEPGE